MPLPATMNAAIVTAYGGPEVVRIETRPTPTPGKGEILVRVHTTTVTSGDSRLRTLEAPAGLGLLMRAMFGFIRPRQPIAGTEAAGTVAALGPGTSRFAVGDEVIVFTGAAMGCHADYVAVRETRPIVAKPEALGFEEAAGLCFGGTTALHFLRKAGIKSGERVLVIGASGAVGTALVQLAKHFGAHVTAAASARNGELVKGLGADAVIDYASEDYTRHTGAYDIIADTVGASSFSACLGALRPGGRYLAIAGGLGDMLARPKDGKRTISGVAPERVEDVQYLADLAARGEYRVVIDTTYPLADIAQALALVDSKRKRGSVVIRMVD